jgi:hypothetical protein
MKMETKCRRISVRLAGAALLSSLIGTLGCNAVVERIVDASVDRQTNSVRGELLEDDALRVFLCGTGSPLADADSAAACRCRQRCSLHHGDRGWQGLRD